MGLHTTIFPHSSFHTDDKETKDATAADGSIGRNGCPCALWWKCPFPPHLSKPIPYTCYCSIEQPFLQASHNHHQIPNTYVHCSPKYPERVCLLLFIMEPSGEKCVLHATNKRVLVLQRFCKVCKVCEAPLCVGLNSRKHAAAARPLDQIKKKGRLTKKSWNSGQTKLHSFVYKLDVTKFDLVCQRCCSTTSLSWDWFKTGNCVWVWSGNQNFANFLQDTQSLLPPDQSLPPKERLDHVPWAQWSTINFYCSENYKRF